MKIKNYYFAGLDFIFDNSGTPWLLEANYAPNGASNVARFEKKDEIMRSLSDLMKKQGENLAVMRPDKIKTSKHENMLWFYKQFKKYHPNTKLCFSSRNKGKQKQLIDNSGNKFRPDAIFRFEEPINPKFEKEIMVVNPKRVQKIVDDKHLVHKISRKAGITTPKSLFIKNQTDLKKLLKRYPKFFKEGYVIKPNNLKEGIGVHVLTREDKLPKIKQRELVEQRIIPPLHRKHYWDVRTFVVNGKYMGGEIRESTGKSRVTNVSRGAIPRKLTKEIYNKLKKPSLQITKAIDQYSEKLFK